MVRFVQFFYYKIANCIAPCGAVHLRCGAIMPFFKRFWCDFCGLCSLANNSKYCCHFISFAQNNLRVKFATKTIKETIKNRNNFFEGKQWRRRGGVRIWASKYIQKRMPILNYHSNPKSLSFLDLFLRKFPWSYQHNNHTFFDKASTSTHVTKIIYETHKKII